jgi:hypothetical protein
MFHLVYYFIQDLTHFQTYLSTLKKFEICCWTSRFEWYFKNWCFKSKKLEMKWWFNNTNFSNNLFWFHTNTIILFLEISVVTMEPIVTKNNLKTIIWPFFLANLEPSVFLPHSLFFFLNPKLLPIFLFRQRC